MQNRRIGLLKEPDNMSDNVLNVGMIKDLTGNDVISARNLHENDNEFRVSTKLFLMCNTLPDVNSNDDGTWDRFRVIHFPIRFCDNPTNPTEKQIDRNIGTKLKEWKSAFMAILIEFYKKYKKLNGIPEPLGITEHTNKYRERNDIFREFIKERLGKSKVSDIISTTILYQEFKGWFIENYPNRKLPVKKEMSSFLNTYFGKDYDGKQLKQYKFKDSDEEKSGKDALEP
jgi:putative DNA primase/helicase